MAIEGLVGYGMAAIVGGGGSPQAIGSVWDLMVKGGWVMAPIGLCSLAALAITAERLWMLRPGSVAPKAVIDAAGDRSRNVPALRQACEKSPSPLSEVLLAAVRARGEGPDRRDRLVEEAGHREVQKLRRRVRLLSALPQVATMLGLLGTVFGMIRTFTVVAASGESLGKTERLAQGIYEAWTATAAGLAVAIPTLIAYHIVLSRIDDATALIDRVASGWLKATELSQASENSEGPAVAEQPVAVAA